MFAIVISCAKYKYIRSEQPRATVGFSTLEKRFNISFNKKPLRNFFKVLVPVQMENARRKKSFKTLSFIRSTHAGKLKI